MPPFLPFPKDVEGECRRAARYLYKVAQPAEFQGVMSKVSEKVTIPPNILKNAKGIAVFKVLKGGFIWSGRMGAGLAVAKLPDGRWSAPATYGLLGVGVGGQIGGQMTYLVLILNTDGAVTAFKTPGNITLGADVAIAAGPVGRDASVNGAVYGFAPIFSYSKSAGLFAGVSLEGTVIIGRRDADSKFYGRKISASEILSGKVEPPMAAKPLYEAIARITEGNIEDVGGDSDDDDVGKKEWENKQKEKELKNPDYNDPSRQAYEVYTPGGPPTDVEPQGNSMTRAMHSVTGMFHHNKSTPPPNSEQGYQAYEAYAPAPPKSGTSKRPPVAPPEPEEEPEPAPPPAYAPPTRSSTVSSNPYGSKAGTTSRRDDLYGSSGSGTTGRRDDLYGAPTSAAATSSYAPPPKTTTSGGYQPKAPVPASGYQPKAPTLASSGTSGSTMKKPPPPPPKKPDALRDKKEYVVALYPFEAVQPGDLELEMGETYEVLEKTPSADGWWKGRAKDGREGLFPGNYTRPA